MKKFKVTILFAIIFAIVISCKEKKEQELTAHPDWSYDATIYEVNTRQFSPEGTFAAVEDQLPRLKELGVDVLWFMPIQPIGKKNRKGELGSYYSISDYTGINPEFGTKEDFKKLVDKAHSMGMKVILDWVANHTAWDSKWTENQSWYISDSLGNSVSPYDWTDVVELDFNNPMMREEMTKSMLYWVNEMGIDGFRSDMALELPIEYWEEAVPKLKAANPDIFMLAEAEDTILHRSAFDMSYAWELHHLMNKIAQGKSNASDLRRYVMNDLEKYPRTAIRMIFTSNHDENSWSGTEFERMGDAAREFAVLSYLLPGMPLIYNGQETGFNRQLEFFTKDSIDWIDNQEFTPFYQTLNKLRKNNPALHSGEKGGEFINIKNNMEENVFSFERRSGDNSVVGIFNFTDKHVSVTLEKKNLNGNYSELFTNNKIIIKEGMEYTIPAWGYRVFYKE